MQKAQQENAHTHTCAHILRDITRWAPRDKQDAQSTAESLCNKLTMYIALRKCSDPSLFHIMLHFLTKISSKNKQNWNMTLMYIFVMTLSKMLNNTMDDLWVAEDVHNFNNRKINLQHDMKKRKKRRSEHFSTIAYSLYSFRCSQANRVNTIRADAHSVHSAEIVYSTLTILKFLQSAVFVHEKCFISNWNLTALTAISDLMKPLKACESLRFKNFIDTGQVWYGDLCRGFCVKTLLKATGLKIIAQYFGGNPVEKPTSKTTHCGFTGSYVANQQLLGLLRSRWGCQATSNQDAHNPT